ncbi:MAG TPA: carbohydrate-binding family 9-like protein [Bacteroidales bacterium]|nr:carbohydrate-binding family 9-like protein [Bacteroidales bacterium]
MLKVKKLFQPNTSIQEAENVFYSSPEVHKIDQINWNNFPYKPDVSFKIAHSDTEIYLQYTVNEKYIRAKYKNDNESVWTDSCVEFFFSPVDDGSYYNLEFNCIGTTLIGFGHGKPNRERAGIDITSHIERNSSLGTDTIRTKSGKFSWQLTLIIPLSAFYKHELTTLSGLHAKGNFYKCGDELKEAHYLSWKPIQFERPNFHLPEFFDTIVFE